MKGMWRAERQERRALILAGGDGTRLMQLSRRITGNSVPKQFCPVLGADTLLDQTRHRVSLLVSPRHTTIVVTRTHKDHYGRLLDKVPRPNIVVQPCNRGTAPAVLYGLLSLAKSNPHAAVALFPSDHYVDNDRRFMTQVDLAFDAVDKVPRLIVLLGISPDRAESDYGWIQPGAPLSFGASIFGVTKFWEKPGPELARKLWRKGCLWNSFVLVGSLAALVELIARSLPKIGATFFDAWPRLKGAQEGATAEEIYNDMARADFSADVLSRNTNRLAVQRVRDVYWNDLGEPARVYQTMARRQISPEWMMLKASPANRSSFSHHFTSRVIPLPERGLKSHRGDFPIRR
jgi:mannose-1-phosphate guanylyltransferase